jgi:hypothetical protein
LNGEPLASPTSPLNHGSTGIDPYRIACVSEDAELLAVAEVCSARSVREIVTDGAFYNQAIEITPATVGRNSLYHSPAGLYAVQALIAQTMGDVTVQCEATRGFIEVSRQPGRLLDVTLGRAGLLLGSVFLLDALNHQDLGSLEGQAATLGHEIVEQLWSTIDGFGQIRESKELSNLGVAYG